jgi:N-acylneuraminate cytidylyltransferase
MNLNDCLVIIPARKNSKRIKGKNLRSLNGKPLIVHSIEYASKFVDKNKIWVNSDDEKIIELAINLGVSVYKRPNELALDETSTNDVIVDFSKFLFKNKISFKFLITLQPTNPIRSEKLILESYDYISKNKLKSLMSVSVLHKKFGRVSNNKYLPKNYKIGQRHQDLEDLYFENGLMYICSRDALEYEKNYITEDVYPFITDEIGSHIDIDYEEDLKMAEIILNHYL